MKETLTIDRKYRTISQAKVRLFWWIYLVDQVQEKQGEDEKYLLPS